MIPLQHSHGCRRSPLVFLDFHSLLGAGSHPLYCPTQLEVFAIYAISAHPARRSIMSFTPADLPGETFRSPSDVSQPPLTSAVLNTERSLSAGPSLPAAVPHPSHQPSCPTTEEIITPPTGKSLFALRLQPAIS
ncbi:hypothetical protein FKP32DRAFT_252962 [Trametes sanguinea]|nr:hypothetical protein FKP32DRAFT_252962 [Trametes sanguinea]